MMQYKERIGYWQKGEDGKWHWRMYTTRKYVSMKGHLKVRNEKGEIIWNPRA